MKIEQPSINRKRRLTVINPYQGLRLVMSAIDAVLEKARDVAGDIECIAPCSFWHSLMGVNLKGTPTTQVLMWSDTRSGEYSSILKRDLNEDQIHNRTGAHFHSSFWPAKLLWLRDNMPGAWDKTRSWISFSDFITGKLTGRGITSLSMASGTGMFDQRTMQWDRELIDYLKILAHLPSTDHERPDALNLNHDLRKRWPRLANARVLPAVADGAADNAGSGCVTKTTAALMVGTSGAMRVCYEGEPPSKIPKGLWCYRVDAKRVLVGGALSDGGGLYRRLLNKLDLPRNAEEEMRRRGAAAHGLVVMPFFAGERSTGYHESAKGKIIGRRSAHDSIDILQAAMESIAYRFAEVYDRLITLSPLDQIAASGGALRESPIWTQIIADVLGRDLTINNVPEASSRGAVLLALESARKIESIESIKTPASSVVAFHPECHEAHKKARERHQEVYRQTFDNNT